MLCHATCKYTRIIYTMHSILRIGAVHGHLIMNKCVHYWTGSGPSQTMGLLIFLQTPFFLLEPLEIRKNKIVYSIDNIKTCLSLVLFD
jgi:hypothetical protein